MRNKGTEFESILETQHEAYAVRGLCDLAKVSQPIKVFGGRGTPVKVVHLTNPFVDFVGAWKERGGRAMFIEAKATQQHRLPINSEGGVKTQQIRNLQRWEKAGAAVGVLWHYLGATRFVTLAQILAVRDSGQASLPFREAWKLYQTDDLIFWDYLPLLRVLYPCTASNSGQSTDTPAIPYAHETNPSGDAGG